MSEVKRLIESESPAFAPSNDSPMDTADECASADWEMFIAAVWREEDRLLKEEGAYHVDGVYYANDYDASIQRRWRAEQIVREAARKREAAFRAKQDLTSTFLLKEMRTA